MKKTFSTYQGLFQREMAPENDAKVNVDVVVNSEDNLGSAGMDVDYDDPGGDSVALRDHSKPAERVWSWRKQVTRSKLQAQSFKPDDEKVESNELKVKVQHLIVGKEEMKEDLPEVGPDVQEAPTLPMTMGGGK